MKQKTIKIIENIFWFIGAILNMWLTTTGAAYLVENNGYHEQFPILVMILNGLFLFYFHLIYKQNTSS